MVCALVGRTQGGRLGVLGRDGAFGDDGRFHPLAPGSQSSYACGGRTASGALVLTSESPPIPASGYTGAPGTRIGGCREPVDLDGPTVSPQTRRRLRGVPPCTAAGLRRVVAGFAGPQAVAATIDLGRGRTRTQRLGLDGAYLFVLPVLGTRRPTLTLTTRDGAVCRPFELQPGSSPRVNAACAALEAG